MLIQPLHLIAEPPRPLAIGIIHQGRLVVIVLALFEDQDFRLLLAAKGFGHHLRKILPEAGGCFDKRQSLDGLRDAETCPDLFEEFEALHQTKQAEEVLAVNRISVAVCAPHHVVIEGNGERRFAGKDV